MLVFYNVSVLDKKVVVVGFWVVELVGFVDSYDFVFFNFGMFVFFICIMIV